MSYVLSQHFTLPEFVRSATADERGIENMPSEAAVALAMRFCDELMEPIRERFGTTVITSGFRCARLNRLVHGVKDSEHIWTAERVAADFQTPDAPLDEVFDWIRLQSKLPFHQVIREHSSKPGGGDCIHISYTGKQGVRTALIGATHNQTGYTAAEVA